MVEFKLINDQVVYAKFFLRLIKAMIFMQTKNNCYYVTNSNNNKYFPYTHEIYTIFSGYV